MNKTKDAVILAAGKQSRFRSEVPKGLLEFSNGESLISRLSKRLCGLGYNVYAVGSKQWQPEHIYRLRELVTEAVFIDSNGVGESIYAGVDLCQDRQPLILAGDTFIPDWQTIPVFSQALYDPLRNITLWRFHKTLYDHFKVWEAKTRLDFMVSSQLDTKLVSLDGWINVNTQKLWRDVDVHLQLSS